MLKNDRWITEMARERGMIEPFEPDQVRTVDGRPAISFGTSSYGYDIRLARAFKVLDPALESNTVIDPKNFDVSSFADQTGDHCVLPPHGMAIVQSLEWFRIPREVLVICFGKSTYARCGIQVALAPLEPEWEGRLTFAVSNTNALPARIYAGEGIAQILFLESDETCRVSYADRKGKYQRQAVLTLPIVK